jgi:prepilin signal peptidase PulO-like enzyme (type II secretory pathway)
MHAYEVYQLAGRITWLVFVFAFGACAGSLMNVLVYRLPLGLGVVTPPSACPACETRLTWRENIPVFGWLFLRGRCRFCKSRISAEYPLVEAFVGLLLAVTFYLWYLAPVDATFLGIHIGHIRPEWALSDRFDAFPRQTWPFFVVLAVLLPLLVAMTLVDFKTCTIPLPLPWAAAVTGLVFHTGYAIYFSASHANLPRFAPGWLWAIATPGGNEPNTPHAWWWIGASFGGMVGLGIGVWLLEKGHIRRSFADYHEWEEQALAELGKAQGDPGHPGSNNSAPSTPEHGLKPTDARRPPPHLLGPVAAFVGTLLTFSVAGWLLSRVTAVPAWVGLAVGGLAAPAVAGRLHARQHGPSEPVETDAGDPAMWIAYPHARREMLKELIFLAPCLALGAVSGLIAARMGQYQTPPLWVAVLAGVCMGYLIGGGVVWGVRIFGSLGFGKEAMGLGDVHLMAGVGACLGWIDAALVLPLAAFVGLLWTLISALSGGGMKRTMPFGPYLAAATVLILFGKPLIESGLTQMLAIPPTQPGVNLP